MGFVAGSIGATARNSFGEAIAAWLIANAGWTRCEVGYTGVESPDGNWVLQYVITGSSSIDELRFSKTWDAVAHTPTSYACIQIKFCSSSSSNMYALLIAARDSDYITLRLTSSSSPYYPIIYAFRKNGYIGAATNSLVGGTSYIAVPVYTAAIWRELDDAKPRGYFPVLMQPCALGTTYGYISHFSIVTAPSTKTLLFPIYCSANDGVELFALDDIYGPGADLIDGDTIQYDGKTFTVYTPTNVACQSQLLKRLALRTA